MAVHANRTDLMRMVSGNDKRNQDYSLGNQDHWSVGAMGCSGGDQEWQSYSLNPFPRLASQQNLQEQGKWDWPLHGLMAIVEHQTDQGG